MCFDILEPFFAKVFEQNVHCTFAILEVETTSLKRFATATAFRPDPICFGIMFKTNFQSHDKQARVSYVTLKSSKMKVKTLPRSIYMKAKTFNFGEIPELSRQKRQR